MPIVELSVLCCVVVSYPGLKVLSIGLSWGVFVLDKELLRENLVTKHSLNTMNDYMKRAFSLDNMFIGLYLLRLSFI